MLVNTRLLAALLCWKVDLHWPNLLIGNVHTFLDIVSFVPDVFTFNVKWISYQKKSKKESHTSQLNSMSDSIVQILTLKFLGCLLKSEFNPIFLANALAIAKTQWSNLSTIQSVKLQYTALFLYFKYYCIDSWWVIIDTLLTNGRTQHVYVLLRPISKYMLLLT